MQLREPRLVIGVDIWDEFHSPYDIVLSKESIVPLSYSLAPETDIGISLFFIFLGRHTHFEQKLIHTAPESREPVVAIVVLVSNNAYRYAATVHSSYVKHLGLVRLAKTSRSSRPIRLSFDISANLLTAQEEDMKIVVNHFRRLFFELSK